MATEYSIRAGKIYRNQTPIADVAHGKADFYPDMARFRAPAMRRLRDQLTAPTAVDNAAAEAMEVLTREMLVEAATELARPERSMACARPLPNAIGPAITREQIREAGELVGAPPPPPTNPDDGCKTTEYVVWMQRYLPEFYLARYPAAFRARFEKRKGQ